MKRLNPKTGKPFKRGQVGEDGKVFWQYRKSRIKTDGFLYEIWITSEAHKKNKINQKAAKITQMKTKRGHLMQTLGRTRSRARDNKIPFNINIEHLESIATDSCPILGTDFDWGLDGKGNGKARPSLDKIIPELGYVKGNVAFISTWANTIKNDATEKELYAIADWLHAKRKEVLNAFKEQLAPVSEGSYIQGAVGAELGSVSTPWTWEDYDHTDDHSGAVRGEDTDHCTQEGGGDSVGRGGREVAAPQAPQIVQDNGEPDAEIVRLEFGRRYLLDKP